MAPWDLLWTAPELLRGAIKPDHKKADIYSVGIIIQEMTLASPPYPDDERLTTKYEPEGIC